MSEITFRTAWRRDDPILTEDAKAFWEAEGALSAETIGPRLADLCAAAYQDNRMVAVSTAHFFDVPRLRGRFFFYRTTVARACRRQRLASRLCVYSRDMLAKWSQENSEQKVLGLFIVIQAEEFKHRQHVPIARQLSLELVLVGYTPAGHQMRVIWFDHARVE